MDVLAVLIARSQENIATSQALRETTRMLVGTTRRLRRPRLAGASDDGAPAPVPDSEARVIRTGCDERLAPTERELEIELARHETLRLRRNCFVAWSHDGGSSSA
jgi:hypothetical protein